MSTTLTKREREGLEDVFLSIHANKQKYEKLKEISNILLNNKVALSFEKLFKVLHSGVKQTNFSDFTPLFTAKKKHLRK